MNITLFSYSKRGNSTARPALSSGTEFQCKLKEVCSIMAPRLEFNLSFTVLPQSYNYAYIAEFQRFYWITNWTYTGRLWVASCIVDVLATHRTAILNSSQYVIRSASRSDGAITDTTYLLKNEYTTRVQSINLNYASGLNLGTYIIGVINGDSNALGSVSYYYMSQTQFNALKSYLLEVQSGSTLSAFLQDVMTTVTDISEGAVKALFNPLQYIASCYWVPYQLWHETPSPSAWVDNLQFGWWTLTGISAERITENDFTPKQTLTLTLSNHPQVARGAYLNNAPFTDYVLFLPPYGMIPLDAALCAKLDSKQITIEQEIDLITGNGVCVVHGSVNGSYVNLCPIMQAPLAIPIQLSQISMNIAADWRTTAVAVGANEIANLLGANMDGENAAQAQQAAKAVKPEFNGMRLWDSWFGKGASTEQMSQATGVDVPNISLPDVSALAANISSAAKANMTQLMSTGINGNLASLKVGAFLMQVFYTIADEDLSHRGRPLCKVVQLSTLSGFAMCSDPDISLQAPASEIAEIKSILAGGVYIE